MLYLGHGTWPSAVPVPVHSGLWRDPGRDPSVGGRGGAERCCRSWPCRTEGANGKMAHGKKKKYPIRDPVVKLLEVCVSGKMLIR